ncbi:hypothetical protein ABZV93_17050 [Actinopolymorpha sp. NPDC004070]|uniref:hypothetical protein n=1 Tax=Actinopolymorpha sp. NPDC004070 TaxID=3154548 RepID=UPI0033B1F95F
MRTSARSSSPAVPPRRRRHGSAPAAPSSLLLLSVLAVVFGGLLTGPGPFDGPSSAVHAAAGTRIWTPAADPAADPAATSDRTGEQAIGSAAPRPDRGDRPDAIVPGAPLVSWIHGLNSTLPDQPPTLGVTAATAPLPGATRHVHATDTDHHPSRAPPQA